MTRSTGRALCAVALVATMIVSMGGCTRRQVIPGVVAGAGAAMVTSGAIYRATMETEEPFGDTAGEIAGTTILLFGGVAALVTGIVLSITFAHCENNEDCWGSDVCELRSHTCISAEAARSLGGGSRPAPDDDEEPSEGASPGDPEEEPSEEDERPPYPG